MSRLLWSACFFPVVDDYFFCFLYVEVQVVLFAPPSKCLNLVSVGCLIVVRDQSEDGGVVCKFKEGVGAVGMCAVVGVQRVESWTEYATLGYTGVEDDGGRDAVSQPDMLDKSWIHRQSGVPSCSLCSLQTSLPGWMELNAELKSTNNILT